MSSNLSELRTLLVIRQKGLRLTDMQLHELVTMDVPTQYSKCFIEALWYLLMTSDFMGAAKKFIQCLLSSGQRTMGDLGGCIVNFFLSWLQGVPLPECFVALVQCVFSTPPDEPPDEPPIGDVPEFSPTPVDRC